MIQSTYIVDDSVNKGDTIFPVVVCGCYTKVGDFEDMIWSNTTHPLVVLENAYN